MKNELEAAREQKYVGVAELTEAAAKILTVRGFVQERATVSDVPDERTVRYYLSEGLIAPTEEKQGTASVYAYKHLLQILAVKQLQADHLPIRKIRELVEPRTTRELERLLGISSHRTPTTQAKATTNDAMNYLETLLTTAPRPPAAAPSLSKPSTSHTPQRTWQRIEVETGLELHVRDDYRLPTDARGVRRLLQLIGDALEKHRKSRHS